MKYLEEYHAELSLFMLSAGAAAGYAVETNTNDVARERIVTIDTCMDTIPHETKMTDDLEACFWDGVPGGNRIGEDIFDQGDPIEFVDAYRTALGHEAYRIEANRLLIWSTLGVVAVAYTAIAIIPT